MLSLTGSTVAPPPNQRFSLTNVSWLLGGTKSANKKKVSTYFLLCKGLSNKDVGVARGTVSQEVRPGAGFRAANFVNEKLGRLP